MKSPKLFTLGRRLIYGLFASLGCFELQQAIHEDYLRSLFICLFIANVCFLVPYDKSSLMKAVLFYGVVKVILASIAINALRKDRPMTERAMILCIVEVVLIFGPLFIGLVGAALVFLIHVTCHLINQKQKRWMCVAISIWLYIIPSLILGLFEIVQASEDDYLRTMFILFAISNLVCPIINVILTSVCYNGREEEGFVQCAYLVAKITLSSLAIHYIVKDPDIPPRAKTLFMIETVSIFGSVVIIFLVWLAYSALPLLQLCYQRNASKKEVTAGVHDDVTAPHDNVTALHDNVTASHPQGEITQEVEISIASQEVIVYMNEEEEEGVPNHT